MIRRKHDRGPEVFVGIVLISCFALPQAWAQESEGQGFLTRAVGRIECAQSSMIVRGEAETAFHLITGGYPVFVNDTIDTIGQLALETGPYPTPVVDTE